MKLDMPSFGLICVGILSTSGIRFKSATQCRTPTQLITGRPCPHVPGEQEEPVAHQGKLSHRLKWYQLIGYEKFYNMLMFRDRSGLRLISDLS